MRISDWSSDVCSSDLEVRPQRQCPGDPDPLPLAAGKAVRVTVEVARVEPHERHQFMHGLRPTPGIADTVDHQRSDKRRVGKEGVSTFRFRCAPYNYNRKYTNITQQQE